MTLREARVLFTKLSAELVLWVDSHDGSDGKDKWEFAESEGYVKDTDAADGDYDGPHKEGGAHYTGTGKDFNLYINGVWIKSAHPTWKLIAAWWKARHPLCRWGGDFTGKAKGDFNHFSIAWAGGA